MAKSNTSRKPKRQRQPWEMSEEEEEDDEDEVDKMISSYRKGMLKSRNLQKAMEQARSIGCLRKPSVGIDRKFESINLGKEKNLGSIKNIFSEDDLEDIDNDMVNNLADHSETLDEISETNKNQIKNTIKKKPTHGEHDKDDYASTIAALREEKRRNREEKKKQNEHKKLVTQSITDDSGYETTPYFGCRKRSTINIAVKSLKAIQRFKTIVGIVGPGTNLEDEVRMVAAKEKVKTKIKGVKPEVKRKMKVKEVNQFHSSGYTNFSNMIDSRAKHKKYKREVVTMKMIKNINFVDFTKTEKTSLARSACRD